MSETAIAPGLAAQLRERVEGRVTVPGDPQWDGDRQPWNLSAEQHPGAVVTAATTDDVVEVVRFARDHRLRVAPQGTGHGATGHATGDDVILLRTSQLTGTAIDPATRTAAVRAGAVWRDVVDAAAEHGLAGLAGSSPTVGVAGYTLGGGIGWLGRRYGLAAHSLVAAQVVTGDGRLRTVDAAADPELFWALRGGGGNVGIVTGLRLRLQPVVQLYAGALFWPLERAADVLHAWREWTTQVPDTVTSIGRLLRFPPLPDIPDEFRGRAFVVVEAACLDDEPGATAVLAPLRALAPEIDTFGLMPPPGLSGLHMDPEEPSHGMSTHRLLGDLPASAVDAVVDVAGPASDSSLVSVEIRHLGGALADANADACLAAIPGQYLVAGVGVTVTPDLAARVGDDLRRLHAALAPWDAGAGVLNFAGPGADVAAILGPETAARLRAVRDAHDPDGVLVANVPVTGSA